MKNEDLSDEELLLPALIEVPRDPSRISYSSTFVVELALKHRSVQEICDDFGVDRETWYALLEDPVFLADLRDRQTELKTNGVSFKLKAGLQAEALLQDSWTLIHRPDTPAVVKADLIKWTARVAGLDASKDQAAAAALNQTALQININLGDK